MSLLTNASRVESLKTRLPVGVPDTSAAVLVERLNWHDRDVVLNWVTELMEREFRD